MLSCPKTGGTLVFPEARILGKILLPSFKGVQVLSILIFCRHRDGNLSGVVVSGPSKRSLVGDE
jgi:hypothetical protein